MDWLGSSVLEGLQSVGSNDWFIWSSPSDYNTIIIRHRKYLGYVAVVVKYNLLLEPHIVVIEGADLAVISNSWVAALMGRSKLDLADPMLFEKILDAALVILKVNPTYCEATEFTAPARLATDGQR